MIFKDRSHAGHELVPLLRQNLHIMKNRKDIVVVSLLRGGVVVGVEISRTFAAPHMPLPVAKISSPYNPELAIGAYCFCYTFFDEQIIRSLAFTKKQIQLQTRQAQEKFTSYCKRFTIEKEQFHQLQNKVIIVVDDGIATGATAKAAGLFLSDLNPLRLVLASPVGTTDFHDQDYDDIIFLNNVSEMSAVSQYYESFPQVSDEDVDQLTKYP